jgi:hypothetical protein
VPIQAPKALNQAVKALNHPDKILIQKANNPNQRLKTLIQALKKLNQLLKKAIQHPGTAENRSKKRPADLKFDCNPKELRNPFESSIRPRWKSSPVPAIASEYRPRNPLLNAALSCLPPPLRGC